MHSYISALANFPEQQQLRPLSQDYIKSFDDYTVGILPDTPSPLCASRSSEVFRESKVRLY